MTIEFLKKIQLWPERIRKIIFWVILIVLALIMLSWWIGRIPGRIKQLELPKIEMPKFEIPEIKTDAPPETQV